MIKVAIVDDQALVRQGIASLTSLHSDIEVVWQASNGEHVIEQQKALAADVILMDIRMPGKNGIEVLTEMREQAVLAKVIILTTFDEPDLFIQAMQSGANGFLLKDVDMEKLHQAIITVFDGQTLAEPVLLNQLSQAQLSTFADSNIERLSRRELEILKLIAGGYSNKEIAAITFLADGTVKNHVSNILAKLKTRDRTRAVLKALSAKLI